MFAPALSQLIERGRTSSELVKEHFAHPFVQQAPGGGAVFGVTFEEGETPFDLGGLMWV